MATQVLPIGSTAATSADITLADGESMTLFLTSTEPQVSYGDGVQVQIKGSNNSYYWAANIGRGPIVISAKGTYRVSRAASTTGYSVGVDRG